MIKETQPFPKPEKPCYNCYSITWWGGERNNKWVCGICHPKPREEGEDMVKKMELINGKFIMKEEEKQEIIEQEEWKPKQKQRSDELVALRDRVILGNQKLFDAWLKIREFAHDSAEWSRQMDRWSEAQKKLQGLCSQLKLMGYEDCLYIKEGKKFKNCLDNPDGFWCQVCPSIISYWEKELQDL